MAQIKFDRASYGEAIMNALEALQRDPTDKLGNSIVAVSGLGFGFGRTNTITLPYCSLAFTTGSSR
jgi:hypothetical protein